METMKVASYTGELGAREKYYMHLEAYVVREVDGYEVGLFRLQETLKQFKGTNKPQLKELIEIYKLRESEWDIKRALFGPSPKIEEK